MCLSDLSRSGVGGREDVVGYEGREEIFVRRWVLFLREKGGWRGFSLGEIGLIYSNGVFLVVVVENRL